MRFPRLRAVLVVLTALAGLPAPAAAPPAAEVAGVLEARAAEPQPRVRADALARVLGATVSEDAGVLVLRRGDTTLTIFDGSEEVLTGGRSAPTDALSAPARREPDGWWLPLDAGAPLGLLRVDEAHVRAPDGRVWRLAVAEPAVRATSPRAEVVWAAPGARGVQLFAPGPDGAGDVVGLWVSDLATAALLAPGAREELDAALAGAGEGRALLLVGTSLRPGVPVDAPAVHAGDRLVLAPGERLHTLSGSADAVGPDAPWLAVAWLPAGVRTDRPLRIAWRGVEVDIAFRD